MRIFLAVLTTEWLKLRHSNLLWISICFFIFIPCMTGFMMYISQHPEIVAKMGIVGTKAGFFDEHSWNGLFNVMHQLIAAIGLIGFAFVISWVFGREFIEKTVTELMVMPVKRYMVVLSKFIMALFWNLLLMVVFYLTFICIGKMMHLPGWSLSFFSSSSLKYMLTVFYTIMVITPVALIAVASRGIVIPIAFIILVMILSQFLAMAGFGPYFPWSIPGIFTLSDPERGMVLINASYIILVLTCISGIGATMLWWRYADQK